MNCEVLVIGAGPAGATTALCLARLGCRVVLVEHSIGRKPKLGESLPPGGMPILEELRVDSKFRGQQHLEAWSISSAWGADTLRIQDFSFHPYGNSWIIDRRAFETLLIEQAENTGATILKGAQISICIPPTDKRWQITVPCIGELHPLYVVEATGRNSSFVRRCGCCRRKRDRLVALTACLPVTGPRHDIFSLVEARPDGWWYAAPVPGGEVAATFLTDADLLPSDRWRRQRFWMEQLSETSHIRTLLPQISAPTLYTWPADTSYLETVTGNGWVAVGDAAASFDPLSSLGIINAIETGMRAADALAAAMCNDPSRFRSYEAFVRRRVLESDRLRLSFYAMERRWRSHTFWIRRGAALPA